MKAMVYHKYGSPAQLTLDEIEKPTIQEDEVLVKVFSASVNWLDWHFLTGEPFMVRLMAGLWNPKHKVLGIDLAGEVEAVGAKITRFQVGDAVFGASTHGCFAEYMAVSETMVVPKPENITFEEAGAVSGAAITALHALRDHGEVQPGQKVLINGASGGVGTFAVQIAKSMGAVVTGVSSTRNLDMVRKLGANSVIDYTREDFIKLGEHYDLIFDVAAKRSFTECKAALSPNGKYITTAFSPILMFKGFWVSRTGSQHMVPLPPTPPSKTDQEYMRTLLESRVVKPVIDRCYPLVGVPEALEYLETGHVRGKVVITLEKGA